MCVVGIESISRPATPNDTAAENRTSTAGNNNSVDPLVEIGGIGGQEGNPDNTDEDDTDDDGDGNKKKTMSKRQKSPVKSKILVPLMKAAITEWPNISNKEMVTILRPYINDIFINDALLQKTCSDVRTLVFGDPIKNVELLGSLAVHMEALGHYFEVTTKTQREVIQKLEEIVLSEHVKKAKKDGDKMKRDNKIKFVKEWKEKNYEMLLEEGLVEGTTLHKFVGSIFMATSTSKQNVPLLQIVYESDAAHMNFGKYTLDSCYGITANCNASPVAFGVVFGNEDKSGWVDFWTFAKKIHPCLNTPETTIITNWKKGSIEAMAEVLPLAFNFFCSFHRKKNVETFVKGGKGKYSCHWFYQQLLNCSLQETLPKLCFDHSAHINDKALQYINLVPDHQQFPAARCAMGDKICMYQRSSQSSAESMNYANLAVRERTAVYPVNATILLLQLETKCYNECKAKAWNLDEVLTPHGKKLGEDAIKDINHREYKIHINAQGDRWLCHVERLSSTN